MPDSGELRASWPSGLTGLPTAFPAILALALAAQFSLDCIANMQRVSQTACNGSNCDNLGLTHLLSGCTDPHNRLPRGIELAGELCNWYTLSQ